VTQILHVTTGLPASGKTTFARSLGVPRFNLDEYRAMLGFTGEDWSKDRERLAVTAMLEGALAVARTGSDIVLDNTHLNRKLSRLYKDNFVLLPDARFEVHDFTDVPIEACILRDAHRTVGRVGEAVIRRLAKDMEGARKGGWRLTTQWMNDRPVALPYVPDESLPKAIGCDLDGTLALHVARGPFEFDKIETDAVNEPVAQLLRMYRDAGFAILLLSGGQGEYKENRERWLAKNSLPYDEFHTRKPDDRERSDDVVKLEMFDEFVRYRYNFQAMLDDRNRLVRLWRAMGIFCPQVAYGNF
jgi:predicted kinase